MLHVHPQSSRALHLVVNALERENDITKVVRIMSTKSSAMINYIPMASLFGPSLQLRFRTSPALHPGWKALRNIVPWIRPLRFPLQCHPKATRHRFATKATIPLQAPLRHASKSKPSPKAGQAGAYETTEQGLAKRSSATLLYEAPPSGSFFLGYYLLGGFSFTYAIINSRLNILDPIPGTPSWVVYSFVGINIFAVGAGLFFLTRVSSLEPQHRVPD